MNTDDRSRAAFDELRRRTEILDPQYSLQRIPRQDRVRPAWMPALAGAVVVATVIGVVAAAGLLSGPPDDRQVTDTPVTTTATTAATSATTEPTSAPVDTTPTSGTDLPTYRVTGVAVDDVLNVRRQPGAAGALYAALSPDYAGIRPTGNTTTVGDGGEWWEVELVDPVRLVDLGEPLHGAPVVGWVNAAYLAPYDPSYADVPPCSTPIGAADVEPSSPAPDHVYAIREFDLGGCTRIVVSFGTDFDVERPPYDRIGTDVRPAGAPSVHVTTVNGTTVVSLDGVAYAGVDEAAGGGAVIGRWTDGSLAVFTLVQGSTSVETYDGRLLIDTHGTPTPTTPIVHLIGEPVVGPGGTVEVWGLARPFEATLGTTLSTPPSGGEAPSSVMTNDWTVAWGLFRYRASRLPAGENSVRFTQDAGGGVESVDVPFTVPERDPSATVTGDDLALTDALAAYARGDSTAEIGFTDDASMWLGIDHRAPVASDWTITSDAWNGYGGPFDVLGPLRGEPDITITTVGPHGHCAGPPLALPADLRGLRRVSIQPAGIDSCLQWYAIDLFLDGTGRVADVMLDLWEP